ncbi:MAG TPA: CRISPR-associated endonuclease Cas1 [Candidatus Synoicihabitans sp.]|nr:CRISPR-associated endonuclease Cas1 [Candidatus Synoicihabitans sp.]
MIQPNEDPVEPLPARMLNEFVYCPRLFYYEHVEGVFVHNADTRRGAALHQRVDAGKGALPASSKVEGPPAAPETPNAQSQTPKEEAGKRQPAAPLPEDRNEPPDSEIENQKSKIENEVIHSRSVSLSSDRLGVTAKMDLVEVRGGGGTANASDGGNLLAPLTVCPVDYKIGAPREGDNGPEIWDADRMQLGLQCLILRDNGYTCHEGVIYYRTTKQRVILRITPELERWIDAQIDAARRTVAGPIPPPLVDSPKCPRCSLVTICLPDETRLLHDAPIRPDEEDTIPRQSAFGFDREFGAVHEPEARDRKSQISNSKSSAGGQPRRLIAPRDDTRALYIATAGVSLGRKSELLQVREKGEVTAEIRINDLSHVAIFGAATVSTSLLQTLGEKDVPVSYFSSGGYFYGLTRGHSLKNVFTRVAQFRAADDAVVSLALARLIVHGKIRNQRTLLMRNHATPPTLAITRLRYAAQHALEAADLGELLGLEGAAALAYFENFSGMIKTAEDADERLLADDPTAAGVLASPPPTVNPRPRPPRRGGDAPGQQLFTFDFTRRNRRPPRDAVNALLSLGYSLLARDCTVAAHAVGLDPYVGFYHQPRFGRPALALDLMEEFRPLIADSVALTLINNRIIGPEDFVRAGEAVNLSPAGRKRFFAIYEQRMNNTIVHPVFDYQVSYRRALELQARLLAKALTGEIEQYIPFTTR